ncbi:MAG: rhomboid family intramembrane serine protease [Desulfobacterales bacterium]|nr:rhomboid family intramembrane serine protease [Desulfobacterales bacterium]
MIPIRDTIPSKNYPIVNYTIIGLNIFFFYIQSLQGNRIDQFLYLYGLVPARYSIPYISEYFHWGQQFFSFLSFMFLHGDFLHLLGNMWSLWIFGDNVEDKLGSIRYALFYLFCGFVSGLVQLFFNLHANIPTIGASGAIAGVMGAYFILYPNAKILTLIPIIIIPWFVELPAFIFLGFWFLMQFINAASASVHMSNIAWWAHIGGFVCGMILLKVFHRIPAIGIQDRIRYVTEKKTTPVLQVIQVTGHIDDPNLYGRLNITPHEAMHGAIKMVNIPWGFYTRMYKIKIPPGTSSTSVLRLQGLGKINANGQRGDLMLTIFVA